MVEQRVESPANSECLTSENGVGMFGEIDAPCMGKIRERVERRQMARVRDRANPPLFRKALGPGLFAVSQSVRGLWD
jgi:hypothetical protein